MREETLLNDHTTDQNNIKSIEKIYSFNEEVAKANTNIEWWSVSKSKRKKQEIKGFIIFMLIIFPIFFLEYLPFEFTVLSTVFGLIIIFYFVVVLDYQRLGLSQTTVFVLTKQKELFVIVGDPRKIGRDLAVLIGVDIAVSKTFQGNSNARKAAGTVALAGATHTKNIRQWKLFDFISDPQNVENILNQKELRKDLNVYKVNKTSSLIEKKNYYKGEFLVYDYKKNIEKYKTLNIAKVYNDYQELIGLINLKK